LSTASPIIEFCDVRKVFFKDETSFDALGPISFTVRSGEFLAILGASGCGKSTTLNMTAGLMKPSAGRVHFKGKLIETVNTEVGYLTQKDSLLPWRTVAENVALPLELRGMARSRRHDLVATMLASVGLTGFEKHYPAELSGGMRKRVAIARMLILAPNTLLLDEPFAALDAQLRAQLQQQLLDIWQKDRRTVIFVTHDITEALKLADRIIVLTERPGRIEISIDVSFSRPRNLRELEFTPEFVEKQRRLAEILHSIGGHPIAR